MAFALVGLPVFAQQITDSPEARLSQAVTDYGVSLSDSRKADTVLYCQTTQVYLNKLRLEADRAVDQRIIAYTTVQKELQAIKLRMNRQGADASEADLLTGKIQQNLDDFEKYASDYQTALFDTTGINCQQQPEYFQAGLMLVRIKRSQLLSAATDLKDIVINSDNNIFDQLKRRLVI